MDNVDIGIATYGAQAAPWWTRMMLVAGALNRYGIRLATIHTATTMLTDSNRNQIAQSFLEGDSEWLFWIDTDNIVPLNGLRKLLDTGKTLVSGLYMLKNDECTPVAYTREPDNRYRPIGNFNRGEIIPVDMAGMGCVLTHRSVFEDIRSQFVAVQTWEGGIIPVHKDSIKGELPDKPKSYPNIDNGILRLPVCKPTFEQKAFPWFVLMYGRTEDLVFYEMAKRAGHQAWCDTSVMAGHLGNKNFGWDDYLRARTIEETRIPENLDVEVVDAQNS